MRLGQGIHDAIPEDVYHRDPAPEPSLSAGTAHRLLTRSPLHAWHAHPRLNPNFQPEDPSNIMDFGTAAHSLLLQGTDICHVVEGFENWKRQAARDERDRARSEGLVPMLRADWERMCELCETVKRRIARHHARPLPLQDGKPEQTLIWQEDDVWCRARIDWLHVPMLDVVDDLKTTSTTANPRDWARNRLFADGKDIQCVLYRRGLRAVADVLADWRFVVVETDPPYGISVVSLSPDALELAERKVDRALELWRRCLQSGEWPGYPTDVAFAELPAWEEARFLEAHYEEEPV